MSWYGARMRPLTSSLAFLLLSACSGKWSPVDVDGDGFTVADGDCWDNASGPLDGISSADVNPDAAETFYDGLDQNCDGLSDFDKDGDGHASLSKPDPSGDLPSDDCWDDPDVLPGAFEANDPADQLDASAVFTGAVETWYDGIDQDCAGDDDFDQDGDGFASATFPDGEDLGDDCYDGPDDAFENGGGLDPADVNPDAEDAWYDGSDADCAGNDDFDQDEDGYARDAECDDLDPARYPDPTIPEVWYDGFDDNCDGNDGDQDGDGYYVAGYAFEVPVAYETGDCWDDPLESAAWTPLNGLPALSGPEAAYPGAPDAWYDGLDQDCAGDDDFDQDLDGYRTDAYVDAGGALGGDCDDTIDTTNPGATEVWYDDVDADCTGDDDFDQDADGYATDTDCNDVEAAVNPGALEACGNVVDEDCSGSDNDEGAFGCTEFHADADADGYGSDASACLCEAEGTYTEAAGGDCDDADATVSPAGTESCATVADDDCDGSTNSVGADGCTDWYTDVDGDTYGAGAAQCQCEADGAYTADKADDCNDAIATVYPGRTETCNDIDDDCDGTADDGLPLYYVDVDGDSYGAGTGDCAPTGRVANADDCDDASVRVYPGAAEYCDGLANDCDTEAAWTSADEDLLVSFVSTSDVWSDVSSTFAEATAVATNAESGTYYFCAGTYYTKFVANADTTDVVGVYGADVTIFDNNTALGSTVSVTNGSVTVSGLTITGGHGSSNYGGGVIVNVTSAEPTPTAPTAVLEDCIVSGNTATNGGGVAAYNKGWVSLVRTTVEDNTATDGGGIITYLTGRVSLEDSTVQNNTASDDGGGIFLDDGTLTMTGSYLVGNDAAGDGGGLILDTGVATCTLGGITGNTAVDKGGGVYLANQSSTTASFTSSSCDFGTGADDNLTYDVTVKKSSYTNYTYGATASFVCTNLAGTCL